MIFEQRVVVGAEVAGHADTINDAIEHPAKTDAVDVAGMNRESDNAASELIHDDQDPVTF